MDRLFEEENKDAIELARGIDEKGGGIDSECKCCELVEEEKNGRQR